MPVTHACEGALRRAVKAHDPGLCITGPSPTAMFDSARDARGDDCMGRISALQAIFVRPIYAAPIVVVADTQVVAHGHRNDTQLSRYRCLPHSHVRRSLSYYISCIRCPQAPQSSHRPMDLTTLSSQSIRLSVGWREWATNTEAKKSVQSI